jgi:FlaA1/EpsC-like NDP-sugar epimerase
MSGLPMREGRVDIDWAEFLGRPPLAVDPEFARSAVAGKSVLITGAGGSIGSGLARVVVAGQPRTLVLLDLSEGGLHECYRHIIGHPAAAQVSVVPVVGSVCDRRLLSRVFQQHGVEAILHAAAYKHVPLMEQNPFSAIANNAIGTYRLVTAACEAKVSRLTMVSTDKAVNPCSVMGASKRIAELAVLSHSTPECRMNAVRLGNVLGSSGSVVPIFQEQLQLGLPLTVTHPETTRYFLTPAEAEAAILRAVDSSLPGKIFIADCGEAHRVVELARYIAKRFNSLSGSEPRIEYIGLRPGDKLVEELVSDSETIIDKISGMRILETPHLAGPVVASLMQGLGEAVCSYNLGEMMELVAKLVPGYEASQMLKLNDCLAEAH